MDETTDFGFERVAGGVEEIGKRTVAGSFPDRRAGGTNGAQFFEIDFQRVHIVDAVSVRGKIGSVN
jgi:hypothetical protein